MDCDLELFLKQNNSDFFSFPEACWFETVNVKLLLLTACSTSVCSCLMLQSSFVSVLEGLGQWDVNALQKVVGTDWNVMVISVCERGNPCAYNEFWRCSGLKM
jgi:hypothetical protein